MNRPRALFLTKEVEARHSWTEVERIGAEPVVVASETPGRCDLEAIYDEHLDFVWRSLHRLGVRPASLEDAVQDVFLVVHRRLGGFEGRSTLKTWLFGIAIHVAREHARRTRKHGDPLEVPADVHDELAPDPFEQAERTERRDLLYALLAELEEDKRAVFILAEIEDMSVAEIAAGLGLNANTVASRLRVAREKFEAALRRHRARASFPKAAR